MGCSIRSKKLVLHKLLEIFSYLATSVIRKGKHTHTEQGEFDKVLLRSRLWSLKQRSKIKARTNSEFSKQLDRSIPKFSIESFLGRSFQKQPVPMILFLVGAQWARRFELTDSVKRNLRNRWSVTIARSGSKVALLESFEPVRDRARCSPEKLWQQNSDSDSSNS